jgi:hypothetical protein
MAPVTPQAKLDIPGVALVFVALSTLIFGLTSVQGARAVTGIAAPHGISNLLDALFPAGTTGD